MSIYPNPAFEDVAALKPAAASVPGAAERPPKSPARHSRKDPDYVATLIRRDTLRVLRRLQKSTPKPHPDLRYVSEACHQLALEVLGTDAIMERAMRLASGVSG